MTTRQKPQWKQMPPEWIQHPQLRRELIFWRDNPSWTAAAAANLVTGVRPRNQPPGILKMLDSMEFSRTTTIQGERNYVDSVLHDQETFLIAARAHHKEEASPKEWLSFADGLGIKPEWLQLAIENGLWANDQIEPTTKMKADELGLTKGAVISAFEGLYFDRDKWRKYLGDPPKWLAECRVAKGNKSTSATWNPVLIAAALFDKRIKINQLDAVFVHMKDWADKWRETSASFRD